MRPLSEDLRTRIVAARQSGQTTGEVCRRFGVSRKSVQRFWNQHQRTGKCRPKKIGGYRRSKLQGHDQMLRRWVKEQPDLSLSQLQQRCVQHLQIHLGPTALWHRLDRLGLTYKKNDPRRRARSARR